MVPNEIVREILIDAPMDVVWRVVTEPEYINEWFTDHVDLDLRPGGDGRFTWDEHGSSVLRVVEVDAPHLFAYRWCHEEGSEPAAATSLLVTFTLRPADDGTLLRVVESGYAGVEWPEEQKVSVFDSHEEGWVEHTDRLARVAADAASATART